eukprot:m.883179 g.883179  ORF g.883179 m.883179 type:complete len:408 (-) comp23603_c0_seq5:278-1501(-)
MLPKSCDVLSLHLFCFHSHAATEMVFCMFDPFPTDLQCATSNNRLMLVSYQLQQYAPLQAQVDDILKQTNAALNAVEVANQAFVNSRAGGGANAERERVVSDLLAKSADFTEVLGNLNEGSKFYKQLAELAEKHRTKVKDFCSTRRDEKASLLSDITTEIASTSAEDYGGAADSQAAVAAAAAAMATTSVGGPPVGAANPYQPAANPYQPAANPYQAAAEPENHSAPPGGMSPSVSQGLHGPPFQGGGANPYQPSSNPAQAPPPAMHQGYNNPPYGQAPPVQHQPQYAPPQQYQQPYQSGPPHQQQYSQPPYGGPPTYGGTPAYQGAPPGGQPQYPQQYGQPMQASHGHTVYGGNMNPYNSGAPMNPALAQLQDMFPAIPTTTLDSVLHSCNGDVNQAINKLLTISS